MLDRSQLGAVLRAGRKIRRIKQSTLAETLDIGAPALSHVEAGRNQPSDRVLELYANAIVGPERSRDLIALLLRVDDSQISEVAEFISPERPDDFLDAYRDALRKSTRSRSVRLEQRVMSWNARDDDDYDDEDDYPPSQGLRSMSSFPQMLKSSPQVIASHPPSSMFSARLVEDKKSVSQRLVDLIKAIGGQVLLTKTKTFEFGSGVSVHCDLIDITNKIAFELKNVDRLDSKTVVRAVGTAELLRNEGFRYVLCVTSDPRSRDNSGALQTLKAKGISVIWPSRFPIGDGVFLGDSIY